MAKRYHQENGKHFLENGRAKVRMGFMHNMRIESHPGRVVRVFTVSEVLKQNPMNAVLPGSMLAISFRESDVNRHEYVWQKGEEFQVPLKLMSAQDIVAEKNESDGML